MGALMQQFGGLAGAGANMAMGGGGNPLSALGQNAGLLGAGASMFGPQAGMPGAPVAAHSGALPAPAPAMASGGGGGGTMGQVMQGMQGAMQILGPLMMLMAL